MQHLAKNERKSTRFAFQILKIKWHWGKYPESTIQAQKQENYEIYDENFQLEENRYPEDSEVEKVELTFVISPDAVFMSRSSHGFCGYSSKNTYI